MKSSLEALFALSLLALVAVAAACSGGSGGGGGSDDDDDDVLPTPARPGFVVMRLDTMLSIAVADGSDLVDLTTGPNGEKSLVGFTPDDRVVYMVKPAVSSTAGDLWIVDVDGTNNTPLATGVYGVDGWADPTHLLFTRGPGPDLVFPPKRDLFVVSMDGDEAPLANTIQDETFAGQVGSTVVFIRGVANTNANLFAIGFDQGTETALTTDGGPKSFAGFTGTNRVVYKTGSPADVYAVNLTGGAPDPLATRPEAEEVVAIRGNRVVILVVIPTMDASESDLYAVDDDGGNEATIAATPDFPETVAGITESGLVLVLRQTAFDPPTFEMVSITLAGANETLLTDLTNGGVLAVDGETIIYSSGGAAAGDIFAIESDGTGQRTLADAAGDDIFLTYLNGHVLFRSGTPDKVWTVDADGGNPETLRDDPSGDSFNVALGPMTVLTIVGAGAKTDLVAANTGGGGLRTLAADEDTESYRAITPDGRVIYTLNQGIFLDDVLIVNGDGTGMLNLTDRADEDEFLGFLP